MRLRIGFSVRSHSRFHTVVSLLHLVEINVRMLMRYEKHVTTTELMRQVHKYKEQVVRSANGEMESCIVLMLQPVLFPPQQRRKEKES